ncbi:MAG: GTP 3',8-cyclase MoaA [Methanosarcinales archaeon]|nr:GTP 3',8-cyclase MoaA [Methanosarcinales archaeon]
MESNMLIDPYGRKISSLRISITSRCNLNCFYCHNEGQNGYENEISPKEIVKIIKVAAGLGIRRVKFSGGEPLVRTDFEEMLSSLPSLQNVSATTNGVLLSERATGLKTAGLDRVNISMDTLDPGVYAKICGCSENIHQKVLDGIDAAVNAGLTPVKLNMVMLNGSRSDELDNMIDHIKRYNGDVILQVIEPMDFGHKWQKVDMDAIENKLQSRASSVVERKLHRRKKYQIDGVEVEVVRPIDNSKFCANCNRLRVTADGKLKPCLLRDDNLVDIHQASNSELKDLFYKAVKKREPFYKGV